MELHSPRVVFYITDLTRLSAGGSDGEMSQELAIACFLPANTNIVRQLAIAGHTTATCQFLHNNLDAQPAGQVQRNENAMGSGSDGQLPTADWQQHFIETQLYRFVFVTVASYRIVLGVMKVAGEVFECTADVLASWLVGILEFVAVANGSLNGLLAVRESFAGGSGRERAASVLSNTSDESRLDREKWDGHKFRMNQLFDRPIAIFKRAVEEGDFVAHLSMSLAALPGFSMMLSSLEESPRKLVREAMDTARKFLASSCNIEADEEHPVIGGCLLSSAIGYSKLVATCLPPRLTFTLVQSMRTQLSQCAISVAGVANVNELQSQLLIRAFRVHLSAADLRCTVRHAVKGDLVDIVGDILRRELAEYTLIELRRVGQGLGSDWYALFLVHHRYLDSTVASLAALAKQEEFLETMKLVDKRLGAVAVALESTPTRSAPLLTDVHAFFATCASVMDVSVKERCEMRKMSSASSRDWIFKGNSRAEDAASNSSALSRTFTSPSDVYRADSTYTTVAMSSTSSLPAANQSVKDAQKSILMLTEQITQSLAVAHANAGEFDEQDDYVVDEERIKSVVLVSANQLIAVTCSERGEMEACATCRTGSNFTVSSSGADSSYASDKSSVVSLASSPFYDVIGESYKRLRDFMENVDHMASK